MQKKKNLDIRNEISKEIQKKKKVMKTLHRREKGRKYKVIKGGRI